MAEKKEYRNAVRSRMLIRAAFVDLLHEKPYEKIKATDIINRAGINRSTFYAHYPDIKGILEEITEEIVTVFHDTLVGIDFGNFLDEPRLVLHQMVDLLQQNQELYHLLGQSSMVYEYMEQLKSMLIQQVMNTIPLSEEKAPLRMAIQIQILLSGVIDIYHRWHIGELPWSLEEVTAEIEEMILEWINHAR